MKPFDLHNHSNLSKDGQTSGRDLIDLAVTRGMEGLGICDHDEFPDEELYEYAKFRGIKLALGIEFTCEDAHIIGYNLNIRGEDRSFLEDRFSQLRQDYVDVATKMICGLQEGGVDISVAKVQSRYDKENIQKLFVMKYLAEELKQFPSWAEARASLKQQGNYLKDGTGVSKFCPQEAIKLIHRAGEGSIWAHPYLTSEEHRKEYFNSFVRLGLMAVEANYGYVENGYKGKESNLALEREVRRQVGKVGLAVSGGSDSHFPLKTYSNLKPILPGDFGITEDEFRKISFMFR